MFKRKNHLFTVLLLVIYYTSHAQLGGVHNYTDTSYIAPRDMVQQREFLDKKGSFPSKPRDQWQFGLFGGYPYIDGDCPTAFHGAGTGPEAYSYGFGVHVRKAMGYVFSVRASFAYYNMVGLDYQPNGNLNNSLTILNLYQNQPKGYVHNHRTMAFVGALEGLVSLSNIMFHTKQKRWNLYGVFGYSNLQYHTRMNLMNTNGQAYPFNDVTQFYSQGMSRIELRKRLREMMDNSYETKADVNDRRPNGLINDFHMRHCFSSGVGIEYRVGKRWSLSLEYKRIQTRDDYVDGWYRQSGDLRFPVFTSEWDNIAFSQLGANFNIGNSKKRVPPLWWLNPLEHVYNDLKENKIAIAKMFKVTDDDNDGVLNELDLELNTPEGCPVDTHGVTLDTDGDGVPDCKDKEKLTLQKCFPVDADGVGNCPENACCDSIRPILDSCCGKKPIPPVDKECKIGELPSIQFAANSYALSKDAKAVLSVVAEKMKANGNCNIKVVGYGNKSKNQQQLSWDRVDAIIKYLTEEEGIAESRLIFVYAKPADGDKLSVDLISTTETGPNKVEPPHPQLRKRAAKPSSSNKRSRGVFSHK